MKNIIIAVAAGTFLFASCNNTATTDKKPSTDSTSTSNVFGKSFESKDVAAASAVMMQIKEGKEFNGVMEGRIMAVCQAKGCWADVELPSGKTMKVKFRDANGDEFGIDKNSKGKMIVVNGVGYMDTTSVEMLKHYAEDDGKSKAEIDAIKTPEINPAFTASGAVLKQ